MRKIKAKHIVIWIVMAVVLAALIVGDCICAFNSQSITNLLCGTGLRFEGEEMEQVMAVSDELVQDIAEEGLVLLKNENDTLPLKSDNRKINLFGWASTDNGFLLTGGGSGSASIKAEKKVTLAQGLQNSGFEVNTQLLDDYKNFKAYREDKQGDDPVRLIEPGTDFYTADRLAQAKEFSSTAMITICRWGSENMEIPYTQKKYNAPEDTGRTYLQLSTEEEALIDLVTANFENVIVLLNVCNPIEMGFLDNEKIDAAIFSGMLGQSGTNAIGKILTGAVNPSGRTVDTYVRDFTTNPSYANKRRNGDHIHYTEGIWLGYKWYETADADGFWDSDFAKQTWGITKGYEDVVQYPFGYGLSYTTFEWNVESVSAENAAIANKYTEIEVKLSVTNTGDRAGKDVVSLYAAPPYTPNGIEKSAVNLVAFEKTAELEPGQSQSLTLTFDLYDLASYDAYDRNGNGAATYELDAGTYHLKLMNDAHTLNACEKSDVTFTLPNTLTYKLDPKTKRIVKNRFTGDTAYAGCPIDGSTAGTPVEYLSRGGFAATFPMTETPNRTGSIVATANAFKYTGYDNAEEPTTGVDSGMRLWRREDGSDATLDDLNGTSGVKLTLNEELVKILGSSYSAPEWETFLDQMSKEELFNLVECSGYGNDAILSVGKANNRDYDGPSGLIMNVGSVGMDTSSWTGFVSQMTLGATFSKTLAFQMGRALANEANVTGISGWYAPGANLHRSPYNGRYFEYYSEDGVLSGVMAAYTIMGAKSLNVYCYLKHFALSEMGKNPTRLNVWITEQALRETYLRPFEIAVKSGEANAVMSAFNRIGPVWAGACKPLLTDILRNEWGFRGVVITDWSTGDSYMNPSQGVRAGNDTWLNPNNTSGAPLDRNNPTDVMLARAAAKNMVYTICDTYVYYSSYDASQDDMFTATVGIRQVDEVFPWWVPILVVLNVIVVGIIAWQLLWMFLPRKKKAAAGNAGAEEPEEEEPFACEVAAAVAPVVTAPAEPTSGAEEPASEEEKPAPEEPDGDPPAEEPAPMAEEPPAAENAMQQEIAALTARLAALEAREVERKARALENLKKRSEQPQEKRASTKKQLTELKNEIEELKKLLGKDKQ